MSPRLWQVLCLGLGLIYLCIGFYLAFWEKRFLMGFVLLNASLTLLTEHLRLRELAEVAAVYLLLSTFIHFLALMLFPWALLPASILTAAVLLTFFRKV